MIRKALKLAGIYCSTPEAVYLQSRIWPLFCTLMLLCPQLLKASFEDLCSLNELTLHQDWTDFHSDSRSEDAGDQQAAVLSLPSFMTPCSLLSALSNGHENWEQGRWNSSAKYWTDWRRLYRWMIGVSVEQSNIRSTTWRMSSKNLRC